MLAVLNNLLILSEITLFQNFSDVHIYSLGGHISILPKFLWAYIIQKKYILVSKGTQLFYTDRVDIWR